MKQGTIDKPARKKFLMFFMSALFFCGIAAQAVAANVPAALDTITG